MKRLGLALLMFVPLMLLANTAPTVLNPIADFSIPEDTLDTSINLNDVFYDDDGDDLYFTASGDDHINVVINEGFVTLQPEPDWNGSETLTFTAEDPFGEEVSDQVVVTVTYVNDPPVVFNPILTYSLAYNSSSSGLDLMQVFSDVDIDYGDALAFNYSGNNHIAVSIAAGIVTLTPDVDWSGFENITFTATDNAGASAQHTIEVTVTSPAIANVSVTPNPFSPDFDGQKDETVISWYLSGNGTLTLVVADEFNVPVFTEDVQVMAGWNQFTWDGFANVGAYNGNVVPDGSYGLNLYCGTASYEIDFNIKVDTAPPIIDLIAAFPNPFSPNGDGYQDFHQVRFRVDDTIIRYIGLIRVNLYRELNDPLWPDSVVATNFVEEDCTNGINVVNPDLSVFDELTDGGYLFVIRSCNLELGHEVTLSSGANYDLIIGGNGSNEHNQVEINTGQGMYKIGHVLHPYLTVTGAGADDHEEDGEDNITGWDYLRLFVMEGNASFNIYENGGAPYTLGDLFPIYYGALQNVLHPVYQIPMFSDFQYNITIPGVIEIPETMMSDGRYIWRTIVTDQAMHAAEESGELLVNNFPVQVTSTVEPEQISPGNQDGYFDQAIIQYQVSERSYVTIKVWNDDQTEVVRTLVDALDTAASGYIIWDGTDDNGDPVAAGIQVPYFIEVTAQDVNISEDIVSQHITIMVDNVGPDAPDIFLPGGQAYMGTTDIIMGGISNDIQSDVLLYLNGVYQGMVATTPSYPGYFSFPVILEEGENNIWIMLRDQAYNLGDSSNVVQVSLDSSSPVIDVIFPPPDTLFRCDSIRVRAGISDLEGIGVNPATVKFGFSLYGNTLSWRNAQHIPASNTYYYDYIVDESIDQLDIEMWVQATDLLGNLGVTPDSVHFAYQAIIPPEVLSHTPADSVIISVLPDGHATSLVFDHEGDGLNTNDSRIWLINPTGAVLNGARAFENIGQDLFEITFTPSENMVDGWYEYITSVTDNFAGGGSVGADTTVFLLDATPPTVDNAIVANSTFSTPISAGMIINHSIEYVSIDVTDLNGVNTGTSHVNLYNAENNVLDGVKTVVGNTITWTLDTELLVNEQTSGSYSVRYSTFDDAGNEESDRIDFVLASSNAPQVTGRYPERDSYISELADQTIVIEFNEAVGVSTDINDTYIQLHLPDATVVEHNNGATLTIDTANPPLYSMSLVLDDPLSQLGACTVDLRIENQNNIHYAETYPFLFDNVAPSIDSFQLGLEDGSTVTVFGGEEMNQPVLWGQSSLSDNYGIDFDASAIDIRTVEGEFIAGLLSQQTGSSIRWTLTEPLSAINGQFYLRTILADMAGNAVIDSINFSLSTINTEFTPEADSYVNTALTQVKVDLINVTQSEIVPGGTWIVLTHPDGSLIGDPDLSGGGIGAQLHFVYTDSLTSIQLDLDQPLADNGVDDGTFGVMLLLALPDDNAIPIEYEFVYDRTNPVFSGLRLNDEPVMAGDGGGGVEVTAPRYTVHGSAGDRTFRGWLRSDYYSGRIDSISVEFADATSGVSPSPSMTYLFMADANEVPVPGHKVVSGNTYRWVLDTPIVPGVSPDAQYTIKLKVTDRAGNLREHEAAFTFISDPTPELDDWMPWGIDYTFVHMHEFLPAEFSAVFKDYFGLVEEYDDTYIRVHFPCGDSIYHPHGGDITYADDDSTYTVTFTFDGVLQENGEDDGLYTIDVKATNNIGAVYHEQQWMLYDTVAPFPVEVAIIDDNGLESIVEADSIEVSNGIASIRVKYGDQTAGLYYAPHLTQVTLFDAAGTIVPGQHAYGEWVYSDSLVYWNLNVPLSTDGSDDGSYSIHLHATDRAGNVFLQEVPVTLFSPMSPDDFAWTLDALWRVHLTWNHYIPGGGALTRKQVSSRLDPLAHGRELSFYAVKRRVDAGDWQTLGYTTTNYWIDDLLDEPDGSYEYSLQAFYTVGESPELLTDPIEVKRFALVTVVVTEVDGATLIDSVRVHMQGNDGLYDMEFDGLTVAGQIVYNGVFMDIYELHLSKLGYITTSFNATVDEDPETLTFALPVDTGALNGVPRHTALLQNVPNPFNPVTQIRFALHEPSRVQVTIYNVKGQRVRFLADDHWDTGYHEITWNGRDDNTRPVASGIYFCMLQARGETESTRDMRKMILLK
ncbi:MAG: hypothetical protein K8R90_02415 [Candidatus Cloacimonetes bacterium]|nr:hypothetical protein [Candidatus Cloacimonadota bacterium]